ncbi:hypothetical protein B0I37DRAFT_316861 [Chaetomium sp. MPI-CAGE-AT-0009]|nr:hypothetical protein B0I37DRAFT_316861 [Chaetomium sp. MPI-CAGE-AT-0009]
MADPLSVAGLAAGLVSLGLQVSGGIAQYVDALDCREHDIAYARQQNDSLHKTLQVIETSLVQLRHDHHPATAAVQGCLDSCKTELNALQDLVAELAHPAQSITNRRSKIKSHGKKLLYPFDRPKLQQLETKLHNANATLRLALQALGLAVSQAGVKQLTTLESTLASHATSQASSLLLLRSEVSAINAPLQNIYGALFGFERRFENLESGFDTRLEKLENLVAAVAQLPGHNPTVAGYAQELTPEVFTRRLLAKPGACREICDAASAADAAYGAGLRTRFAPTAPAPIRNGEACHSSGLSSIMGSLTCSCSTRRLRQRRDRPWGYLTFSFERATEQHLPGCPVAQIKGANQMQKLGVRYTGLRRLLKSAVQISFAMQSGAGGWSISPSVTYYPTVDARSAPAFRMIDVLDKAGRQSGQFLHAQQWGKLTSLTLAKILILFKTGKASPLAVDCRNWSLPHHLASLVSPISVHVREEDFANPLLEVLICLVKCGAPANDYNTYGNTPLGEMVRYDSFRKRSVQHAASEYILLPGSEITPAKLSQIRGMSMFVPQDNLQFLSISPDVAQVKYLLEHHPTTLNERNLFGQSPLHLAVDKPSCLRLLVQAADDKLLNETDSVGITAFEMTIMGSGRRCREGHSRRKCRHCQCAECPAILLKADCAVPMRGIQRLLEACSQRSRLRYIRALKNRRDRLKELAMANLCAEEKERLGIFGEAVLDFHAPEVVRLLQQRGVRIPEALDIGLSAIQFESPPSAYELLTDPSDAELFFQHGFRDTAIWLKEHVGNYWWLPPLPLAYIEWLDTRGADALFVRIGSFGNGSHLFTAHSTFYNIARHLGYNLNDELDGVSREWVRGLHIALLRPDFADDCRCRCSTKSCTPLTYFLKGMFRYLEIRFNSEFGIKPFLLFLGLFGNHLEVQHHTASLRFLTFVALGIPHTCCNINFGRYRCPPSDPEEIENEHAYELELLEWLLEEFESELIGILQDPGCGLDDLEDFWTGTWSNRVIEVRVHLDGSALSDAERERAEAIGVVWDQTSPPEPTRLNPFDQRTQALDHWINELEKIEAECQ